MKKSYEALESLNLPSADRLVESSVGFKDGGQYRIEIPSTEGPEAFKIVLEEAEKLDCPVHRISQGSGIQMLSDDQITEMSRIGADRNIEVCLFTTPRANFDIGGFWSAPIGPMIQWQVRGADQLRYSMDDIFRACDLGIRSVLIADVGLIHIVKQLRDTDKLPSDLIIKSVAKTGRLIVADPGHKTNGLSAEICAIVSENIQDKLRSNIVRIAFPDTPTPASSELEKYYYPMCRNNPKPTDQLLYLKMFLEH